MNQHEESKHLIRRSLSDVIISVDIRLWTSNTLM